MNRAVPESCKDVTSDDMILLDSGGQYLDGTTDVTRTFHTGTPSDFQVGRVSLVGVRVRVRIGGGFVSFNSRSGLGLG